LSMVHRDLMLGTESTQAALIALAPTHEIRLEAVTYAYPSTPQRPILNSFNLVITAGTSVGIAGPTGAGKSTLMDILLGLLPPQSGQLMVDGVQVYPGNVPAWQRAIGYVPQNIFIADASVAENIAFGVPPKSIDVAAMVRA